MRSRSVTRGVLGWGFGMAVSVLFLAVLGRAVVSDTDALAESLSPLARSSVVTDYLAGWMSQEMIDSGANPVVVEPAVDYFLQSSTMGTTLERLSEEVVRAAASTNPAGATVDMAGIVGPAVPKLTRRLAELGYPVNEEKVSDVVAGLGPLVIRQPGSDALVGPGSPTASRLGTAALLAIIGMVVFGSGVVALSEDRIAAVRRLMTRIAVGGISFAVFLRVGSWVLDPGGGRAPVPETLSEIAHSQWAVPLQIALVAGTIAAGIYVCRRMIRRVEGSRRSNGQPTPPRERQESLSGSR